MQPCVRGQSSSPLRTRASWEEGGWFSSGGHVANDRIPRLRTAQSALHRSVQIKLGRGWAGPPRLFQSPGVPSVPRLVATSLLSALASRGPTSRGTQVIGVKAPRHSGGSESLHLGTPAESLFQIRAQSQATGCEPILWGHHPAHDNITPTLKVSEFRSQRACGP